MPSSQNLPIDPSFLAAAQARAKHLSLQFLDDRGGTRIVPFALSPCAIDTQAMQRMLAAAPLLGQLTQAIAAQPELIQDVHAPLAEGDLFFAELLRYHSLLTQHAGQQNGLLREPLLLQRSDFMIDATLGPSLVECNSIAAGMGPFGEQVGKLQQQLAQSHPGIYARFDQAPTATPFANRAIENMATAIEHAAQHIAETLDDNGPLRFLMVIQEGEDNVFDQYLLENALRERGLQTLRRSFRELHGQLESGPRGSLILRGVGSLHVVYLRAGYRFLDYVARDLDTQRCCDALQDTRLFIERHKVAVNATVAQQLATSKRMQLHLATQNDSLLEQLGFDASQRAMLRSVMVHMREITPDSIELLREEGTADWVLKNQGEGGGHCLFDQDILPALEQLKPKQHNAWTLMRRLRPVSRSQPALLIRQEQAQVVDNLISEVGLFTAHMGEKPLPTEDQPEGYVGYLVRSKPADVVAGGVHSGEGVLDSLVVQP